MKIFLTVFCIFLPMLAYAQSATKPLFLTMKDAIFLSLRYNPNVQSAELQRVADKFAVAVAKNQFEFRYGLTGAASSSATRSNGQPWTTSRNYNLIPTLSRQTRYGTNFNLIMSNPVTINPPSPAFYNPLLTLTVTQPLLKGSGRLITESSLDQAIITDQLAKLTLKNTVISQVTLIVTDYLNVVGLENTLIVDQTNLDSAKQTVEQNKLRIKAGFMAPSENVQAESAVANQELQVATDKNEIIQAKLQLLQDIGLDSTTQIEVDKTIKTAGMSYPKGEEAKCLMFAHNISYIQALYNLKSSQLSLLVAEDAQRWSLDLTGVITQGGGTGGGANAGLDSLFNNHNKSRSVGLALNVPIDDLQTQQQVVQAKVSNTQTKLSTKQLKLELEVQLQGALQNLTILEGQITLSKTAEDLANQSYQDALKKLAYGKTSVFEVNTLQSTLISAQVAYISNQISYLNAITQFQQNLGITLDVWEIHLIY